MKFTKTQWISITGIVAVLLVGFLGYQNQTKVSVNGSGNATAVGPNAQATVTNELAIYTWTNSNSWVPVLSSNGYYLTNLNFQATSPILPRVVCIGVKVEYNTPDHKIVSVTLEGTISGYELSDGTTCFNNPPSNPIIQIETQGMPTAIEGAKLVSP